MCASVLLRPRNQLRWLRVPAPCPASLSSHLAAKRDPGPVLALGRSRRQTARELGVSARRAAAAGSWPRPRGAPLAPSRSRLDGPLEAIRGGCRSPVAQVHVVVMKPPSSTGTKRQVHVVGFDSRYATLADEFVQPAAKVVVERLIDAEHAIIGHERHRGPASPSSSPLLHAPAVIRARLSDAIKPKPVVRRFSVAAIVQYSRIVSCPLRAGIKAGAAQRTGAVSPRVPERALNRATARVDRSNHRSKPFMHAHCPVMDD